MLSLLLLQNRAIDKFYGEEIMMLGENLQKWRVKKGYNRDTLAYKAGITTSYLYALETNRKKEPSMRIVLNIADALQITIEELLFGSKRKKNRLRIKKHLQQK